MVLKYLDNFKIIPVLLFIFALSVQNTLAGSISQDQSIHIRDSLLNHLNEIELKYSGSNNDKDRITLMEDLIDMDSKIIQSMNDSILSLHDVFQTSEENTKNTMVVINKKLDLLNDRKTKLERTVLILILVLMMLTYYIFKLQRKNSES